MSDQIQALAATLQSQWTRLVQTVRSTYITSKEIEASLIGAGGDWGTMALRDWDTEVDLSKLFSGMRCQLEAALRKELQSRGTPAKIDIASFDDWSEEPQRRYFHGTTEECYLAQVDYAENKSFVDLAERLLRYYSPENATALALREASDRVFRYFQPMHWNQHGVVIATRGDRRVIEARLWWESFSSWEISYSSSETLIEIVRAISTLLSHSAHADQLTESGLQSALRAIGARKYSSRMRLDLGPGLAMIFFKDKIEYVFAAPVLEALQIVIATSRTPDEQDEAA